MRRLIITEQKLGDHATMVVIETSDGKRSSSTTVKGALEKLVPASSANPVPYGLEPLEMVFEAIRDDGSGNSQIHKGVQS